MSGEGLSRVLTYKRPRSVWMSTLHLFSPRGRRLLISDLLIVYWAVWLIGKLSWRLSQVLGPIIWLLQLELDTLTRPLPLFYGVEMAIVWLARRIFRFMDYLQFWLETFRKGQSVGGYSEIGVKGKGVIFEQFDRGRLPWPWTVTHDLSAESKNGVGQTLGNWVELWS